MKKLYALLIIILLLIIALLILFMVVVIKNNGFNSNINYEIIKEEKYSIENIKNMDFEFISSDAYFYKSEDEFIHIVQYGNKRSNKFDLNISNGSLSLDSNERKYFVFNLFSNRNIFKIYIPDSYCENIKVSGVSTDINIEKNICSDNLELKTTSGDVLIKNDIKVSNVTVQSVSGNIETKNIDGDIVFKTTSGDIITNKVTGDADIKSISGKVYISSLTGKFNIKTTSGGIKIDYFSIEETSDIKTISGDVKIILDKEKSIRVSHDTISGNIKITDEIETDRDSYKLNIKTTSGDIKID